MSVPEKEVASYILAYLLQHKYKNSANAFLRECNQLPSKTLIVLPETPLDVIIAGHNSRQVAKVLVNTLGHGRAWQELWEKLNTTLSQIRCLSEEQKTQFSQPNKVKGVSKLGAGVSELCGGQASSRASPHKRKQGPRRKILTSSSPCFDFQDTPTSLHSQVTLPILESDPPTSRCSGEIVSPSKSPTMQQVLDSFLDDGLFPSKLADIINQCVSSDDCNKEPSANILSSNISSETLEQILNVTLSEPTLEGIQPTSDSVGELTATSGVLTATSGGLTATSGGLAATSGGLAATSHGLVQTGKQVNNSRDCRTVEVTVLNKSSRSSLIGLSAPAHPCQAPPLCDIVDLPLNMTFPSPKRARMAGRQNSDRCLHIPSEQDIDSFLDQIHQ